MIKPILASVIFVVILISFVMQRRPAGLTAVVGSLLMMIFGIIEPSDVVAPFGSDTVIMVASVLILGSAVFETGAAEIIGSAIEMCIRDRARPEQRDLLQRRGRSRHRRAQA